MLNGELMLPPQSKGEIERKRLRIPALETYGEIDP